MITRTWKDAATLILAVKSSANAYKILLLQRSSASKFMVIIYMIFIYFFQKKISRFIGHVFLMILAIL